MKTSDEFNIVDPSIVRYLDDLVPRSPSPASEMEERAERESFPIVGPQVGRLLMLFAKLMKPTRIVELGSGFGYSAFWFGNGCPKTEIHLTDYDEANLRDAREYLARTDHPDRFVFHAGDALEQARSITGPINCVLIDIDKAQYPDALDWAQQRLAPGGWLIADNVLWQGNVGDPTVEDEATEAVRTFNRRLYEHPWQTTILPLRDGVAISHRDREDSR